MFMALVSINTKANNWRKIVDANGTLCYEKEKNMHRDLLYTLGLLPLNHQ